MITVDPLLEQAADAADIDPSDIPGDASWAQGLARLIDSLNADAILNAMGDAMLTTQIVKPLANRFLVDRYLADHPDVAARPIEAPVFIVGLPRTGTTLLSYLLASDPANRSLRRWESFDAVPPPDVDPGSDGRIGRAAAEMDALYDLRPEFKAIHYETAQGPTECVVVLAGDMRSIHYETLANVSGYGRFLDTCKFRGAYEHHRRTLQVLQANHGGRWVLKSPIHLLALDDLLAVYPDARFVQTHRDPAKVVVSLAHLVHVLSGLGTDHDFRKYEGRRWLELVDRMLLNGAETRASLGPDRWYDIPYEHLVADPVGEAAQLYRWLGWDFPVSTEATMAEYAGSNPKNQFGSHDYRAKDYGLKPKKLERRFEQYRDVMGIPAETPS
jgi:hypothetical protein